VRPTVDETLMRIAQMWEQRSTCSRNHVGVVIAKDGRTLGSGYNGAPAGMPHCEHQVIEFSPNLRSALGQQMAGKVGMSNGCRVSIHAEANALAYCARNGVSVEGGTIYTTLSPCYACSQLVIAAGLVRVMYGRAYRDVEGIQLLNQAGITVEKWVGLS